METNNSLFPSIENVEQLYSAYKEIPYDEHHPLEVLKAFHEWYDAALVLFSQYFEGTDSYTKFSSEDVDGNQYVVSNVFDRVRAHYKVMMNKLKSQNIPVEQAKDNDAPAEIGEPYVFISHSSKDDSILQLFKTLILKAGLGLKDTQIAYTSDEASGVPAGDNIPLFIKNGIGRAQVVLFMISDNYKASEVCLNEMGAAWALGKHTISIVLPNVSFKSLGWLTSLDKAIKIDEADQLSNLAEVICDKAGISQPTLTTWNNAVSNFRKAIKSPDMASVASDEDAPYLTFDNNTDTLDMEVPFVSACYIPQPLVKSQSEPDMNALIFGGVSAAHILAKPKYIEKVKPTITVSGGTKTNCSMAIIHLMLHTPVKCLENVSVIIRGENLRFDSDNKYGGLMTKILQHGKYIDDEGCNFSKGTCNAGMQFPLPEFYVETKDICGETEDYPEEKVREYKLQYIISTKEKPYSGELLLRIKPAYEPTNPICNNSKAGRFIVKSKEIDK